MKCLVEQGTTDIYLKFLKIGRECESLVWALNTLHIDAESQVASLQLFLTWQKQQHLAIIQISSEVENHLVKEETRDFEYDVEQVG